MSSARVSQSRVSQSRVSQSKGSRIVRRTLVGGSLVTVLASLLWWTSRTHDGRPLFWATALVTLAAVWETSRMGSLALVDLRPALFLAALGILVQVDAGIEQWVVSREVARAGFRAHAEGSLGGWSLLRIHAEAPIVAVAAWGLGTVGSRFLPRAAARSLTYVVVGALIVFAVHDSGASHRILWAPAILCGLAILTAIPIVASGTGGLERLARVGGIALWLVPPLPCLWIVWATWGTAGLVSLLVLSKIGDTCGYYVGSALGKTHPFPRLSPGKTTAGCVGSFVGATAVGGALFAAGILPPTSFGWPGALGAAALINVASQSGDLLESFVKRRAGVKDSSTWLGPSGGLLDQVDSLLLSVPMALATWPCIFAVAA